LDVLQSKKAPLLLYLSNSVKEYRSLGVSESVQSEYQ